MYFISFSFRALKFELWRSGVDVSLGEDQIWWQLFVSELTLVSDLMTDMDLEIVKIYLVVPMDIV